MSEPIKNRYDFVYFFDITDGNPNGDPDMSNLPRMDPETCQGLVTDVCLKRKIRNFVEVAKRDQNNGEPEAGFRIFVRSQTALNAFIADAHESTGGMPEAKKGKWIATKEKAGKAARWLCQNFFDIRTFGAVLSTGPNAGQVRGPVQLGIGRSLHPIISSEFALTRCATTDDKIKADAKVTAQSYRDWEAKQSEDTLRTIGRKFAVPYGLYRVHGYVNPCLAGGAKGTGFSVDDLALLKRALEMMFEQDKSAARANMRPVACIAFKHDSALGNARSDQLFARVTCKPRPGVQPLPRDVAEGAAPDGRPPRAFEDYELNVEGETDLPEGVTLERWIDWK